MSRGKRQNMNVFFWKNELTIWGIVMEKSNIAYSRLWTLPFVFFPNFLQHIIYPVIDRPFGLAT